MSQEKQNAARTAVDQIEDGMMVGLGTGSTAAFAISYLGEKVRSGLTISAIPTSEAVSYTHLTLPTTPYV